MAVRDRVVYLTWVINFRYLKMNKQTIRFLTSGTLALVGLAVANSQASAVTITSTTNNGNDLANNILGSGITISNVIYSGGTNSAGFFTDGLSSGLGIESGILLTSGNAEDAAGPNTAESTSTANGLAGDTDLDTLVPGNTTNDATVLQFDFQSTAGDIFFNYVFASEEYNEFVGTEFNDVFGFFLDGQNIALIPSTTTPVSINNVNLGVNSGFYNNNDLASGAPYNTGYDGFTTVFTASALNIGSGTHTIKLAIADAGDSSLDSGVFIQANSFSSTNPTEPVPEPASMLGILAFGALGGKKLLKRKQKQA